MFLFLSVALLVSVDTFREQLEISFMHLCVIFTENAGTIFAALLGLTVFCLFSYIAEGGSTVKLSSKSKSTPSIDDESVNDSEPENDLKPRRRNRTDHTHGNSSKENEPRWDLFRSTNYAVILMFTVNLTSFFIQIRGDSPSQAEHFTIVSRPVLVINCLGCFLSMIYFFSFFGVSFVSDQTADVDGRTADTSFHMEEKKRPVHSLASTSKSNSQSACAAASFSTNILTETCAKESDASILSKLMSKELPAYRLEKYLNNDCTRAVALRRMHFEQMHQLELKNLPMNSFAFDAIHGRNCESVVGYVPVPVGLAGPLKLDGESVMIPMATTEGCLVASTTRGCKAINMGSGCSSVVLKDQITRAPAVRFPSLHEAFQAKEWLEVSENIQFMKQVFNSTTRFGSLEDVQVHLVGRSLFLRFCCFSGDAMGMNMISKGTTKVLEVLQSKMFPSMEVVSISGNVCSDKKPAAINWIQGRGKSVSAEAVIPSHVVQSVLKTSVKGICTVWKEKCMIGSSVAGSVGGFNCHAANQAAAIFLATGQDIAQTVESANCLTVVEEETDGALRISITMPAVEVGTVGGGTGLAAQKSCVDLCVGDPEAPGLKPGDRARKLARVVAGAVLAGELSLLSALSSGDLVKSHMTFNRK